MSRRHLLVAAVVLLIVVAAVLAIRVVSSEGPREVSAAPPATVVILVPGYGGGTEGFTGITAALDAAGISYEFAQVGDVHGDLGAYGRQVADRVAALSAAGESVGVVGYSAGGLIARAANPDTRVVTIGTPHQGTAVAGLAAQYSSADCPRACQQMAPDSAFLADLPQGTTNWLSLYSDGDDVVRPPDSSELPGGYTLNVSECGVTDRHGELPVNPLVVEKTVAFLSETPLRAPAC